jgi:adenylate kinase
MSMQWLKRIGFYGVSGVGKTTILKSLMPFTANTIWLEGAAQVLKAAQLTLHDFKKLSASEKYHFRTMAIANAFEIQTENKQHLIIDGHLAFANGENEFENVMTENDKRFYTDFIYLKLAPAVILERQQQDLSRNRNYSLSTIHNWIDFELKALQKVCTERNIVLHILESENNSTCIHSILKILHNTL